MSRLEQRVDEMAATIERAIAQGKTLREAITPLVADLDLHEEVAVLATDEARAAKGLPVAGGVELHRQAREHARRVARRRLCASAVVALLTFTVTALVAHCALRAVKSSTAAAVLCVVDEEQVWCAPVEPADVARVLVEMTGPAGEETESNMGKIAFGNAKGQSFEEAQTKDLEWYLGVQKKKLSDEPQGQYARFQEKDIKEIEVILRQRAAGGGAIVPAGSGAAQIVQRAPDEVRKIEGTYSSGRAARGALESAAAMGHLVTPSTGVSELPEGCSLALSVVYVSADSETYDVGGKSGLAKSALQKIGAAAGVSWDATQSGRLDNGADANYCLWKAVGSYRSFDGREIQIVATKEMDLRDGSAQVEALYDRYEASLRKYQDWVNRGRQGRERSEPKEPTGQIREMRLHIAAHAETKAQLRAIRSLGVRSAYTEAELKRPFIVAQLMFTGRSDNPALAEKFAMMRATAMLGGARALYGVQPQGMGFGPAPQQLVAPPPVGRRGHVDDDDLPPDSDPEPPHGAAAGGPPSPPPPPAPPPPPSEPTAPAAAGPAPAPAPVVTPREDTPPAPPPRRAASGARGGERSRAATLPFDDSSGPPPGWVDPNDDGR